MKVILSTYRKKLVAVLVPAMLLLAMTVNAQDCERILKSGELKYQSGHLREIPETLTDCIKNGFTDVQREKAYKLMVLSYLFLDDAEAAEKNLINLLTDNPDYRPSPLDPPEYIYFFNNFRVDPIFSYSFMLGPNYTLLQDVQFFTVGTDKVIKADDQGGISFGALVALDFRIIKNLELNINIGLSGKRFSIKEELLTTGYTKLRDAGIEVYNFNDVNTIEKQFWFDMPVMLKYGIKTNQNIYTYLQGGVAYHKLLGDKITASRQIRSGRPVDGPDIIILASDKHASLRKTDYYSIVVGGGVKLKAATGLYLIGDIKLYKGLLNLRNKDAAINEIPELYSRYGYVDNDFKQNTASFSFGIAKMLYKPKRIKRGGKLIVE